MTTWRETIRAVEARAEGRCEYCRMHQSLQGATFHVEHILPNSRGGSSEMSNLAWCCPSCSLRKSVLPGPSPSHASSGINGPVAQHRRT